MREDTVTTVQIKPTDAGHGHSANRRGLRALVAATAVSSLGDGAFTTAMPLAAAAITRNPGAVAAVAAAEMLPWLLVTPFAGALVDRWPSRPVMVIADVLRAGALAVLAVLMLTGNASIPALAGAACAAMIGMTFHDTAAQRSVLELAGRDADTLNRANGRVSTVTTAGKELAGQPAGSGLFALAPWAPFVADALSFAGSAALMSLLPRGHRPATSGPVERLHQQIAGGAVWLARHPILRGYCILITMGNLAYSAAMATFVLYATSVLGVTAAWYGVLMAAGAVGGIFGGLGARRIIGRIGDSPAMVMAMAAQVAAFLALLVAHGPWIAAPALAVAVWGTALATVVSIGTRQRLTPQHMYGRVTAIFRTFGVGALPIGSALGGAAATVAGLHAPLILAAGLLLVGLVLFAVTGRARGAADGSGDTA
jgi:hypothetical protein